MNRLLSFGFLQAIRCSHDWQNTGWQTDKHGIMQLETCQACGTKMLTIKDTDLTNLTCGSRKRYAFPQDSNTISAADLLEASQNYRPPDTPSRHRYNIISSGIRFSPAKIAAAA